MVTLGRDSRGNYTARKRLPSDVRDDYGRLYGPRLEAKFRKPADTEPHEAKRLYGDWLAEVEGRIANIRAQRKGEGQGLTRQQARALAGQWYDWFLVRHSSSDKDWDEARDQVQDAMRKAIGEKDWEQYDPNDLWEQDVDLRQAVRPVLADVGETAQFLATQKLALNNEARSLFLDFLYKDLGEALRRLIRISGGDYSPDTYREKFPKLEGADTGETPTQLFERWVIERKPEAGTIESWRYVFREMSEHFKNRSATSITGDEAQAWIRSLVTEERSARTVRDTWISASNAVFKWASEQKYIPRNPFKEVKITVPKQRQHRETKAFLPHEYRSILNASLTITDTSTPFEKAKRWVPWLMAYTGARSGEIAQLRKQDVIERDGIHALHFTPDAGTIKNGQARTVPLHEHLVSQGFLKFVGSHSGGPLFYKPDPKPKSDDPATVRKSRAAQVRQRIATWVGSLGVKAKGLSPNHAWRHTFKQIADHAEITERMSNYITGHSQRNEGAKYGAPTLKQMADAMKKFPRYGLTETPEK